MLENEITIFHTIFPSFHSIIVLGQNLERLPTDNADQSMTSVLICPLFLTFKPPQVEISAFIFGISTEVKRRAILCDTYCHLNSCKKYSM